MSPFLIEFRSGVGIRWYGLAYIAAFYFGYLLYRKLAREGYADIPVKEVGDFITWGAVLGVLVGGRLGYMLFYNLEEFLRHPISILRVWDGGMSSHGGILGLVFYTLWYARHKGISWRNIGDNLVVCAPIGLFLGRLANFVNGELYGRPTTVAWAVQFPNEMVTGQPEVRNAILQEAVQISPAWDNVSSVLAAFPQSPELREILSRLLPPRHPSQLYEAFLEGGVLFALLWMLRTRLRLPDGVITGAFFIGYAVLRIAGEFFREPDAPLTGPFTRGQFLSLFMILVGAGFLISARIDPTWAPRWRTRKTYR